MYTGTTADLLSYFNTAKTNRQSLALGFQTDMLHSVPLGENAL